MKEFKTKMSQRVMIMLIACSLFTATFTASTAFSIRRVGAQGVEDVNVEVVSITPVVYYPAVYVWKGQMRIGNGSAFPAMLVYRMNISRIDDNSAVPDLSVEVLLERVNLTNSPAETFSYVNSTSISLSPGQNKLVTLTWYEDGNTSNLTASPKGLTWVMGCLVNVTSPDGVNDTDLSNNLLWNGNTTAYTGLVGDFNGDGFVDIYDALLLANCYGKETGQPGYNPDCNINTTPDPVSGKQVIDILDAITLANNFNKHKP